MIDRAHLERLLQINGVSPTDPDEEITSILISARWHQDDVKTALTILRENPQTHEAHIDTIHDIFRSDSKLRPETISALLGVDVQIDPEAIEKSSLPRKIMDEAGLALNIGVVSLSVSLIFLLCAMWFMHMGIFHAAL
jgi:hypothetical protein